MILVRDRHHPSAVRIGLMAINAFEFLEPLKLLDNRLPAFRRHLAVILCECQVSFVIELKIATGRVSERCFPPMPKFRVTGREMLNVCGVMNNAV